MATFKVPHEVSEADRFNKKFPGRGVPKQSDFLRKRLQGKGGGQYFDSGDYNMQRSSKKKDATIVVGKVIPNPENIPQRKPSCSKPSTLAEGVEPVSPNRLENKFSESPTDEQAAKQVIVDEQQQQ